MNLRNYTYRANTFSKEQRGDELGVSDPQLSHPCEGTVYRAVPEQNGMTNGMESGLSIAPEDSPRVAL